MDQRGRTPCTPAEVKLIEATSDAEWALSGALRGKAGTAAHVIGALLQLADRADTAVML